MRSVMVRHTGNKEAYFPLYAGPPNYTAVSVQAYLQHDAEPNEGGDSQVSQQEQRVCLETFPACQRV